MIIIDQDKILERIVTIIGFAAVILGLLVNGVSKLSFGNSTTITSNSSIFTLGLAAIAIYFLLMSMVIGLSYYVHIPLTTEIKEEPEKILKYSGNYFGMGLLAAGMVIVSVTWQIIFPFWSSLSVPFVIIFILIIYFRLVLIDKKIDKEGEAEQLNIIAGKNNMQCNYLKVEKPDPTKNQEVFSCFINSNVPYDPEIKIICKYCRTDNFVNCPRIKVSQKP